MKGEKNLEAIESLDVVDWLFSDRLGKYDNKRSEVNALKRLQREVELYARVSMLNRGQKYSDRADGFWGNLVSSYGPVHAYSNFNSKDSRQEKASQVNDLVRYLGTSDEELRDGVLKEVEDISNPYEYWSGDNWGQQVGGSVSVMTDIIVNDALTFGVAGKLGSSLKVADKGYDAAKVLNLFGTTKVGRGLNKLMYNGVTQGVEEGVRFGIAGEISGEDKELNLHSGFFGGFAAGGFSTLIGNKAFKDGLYKQLDAVFGNKSDDAIASIYNYGKTIETAGKAMVSRAAGETVQE